jgi:hypothetical protein
VKEREAQQGGPCLGDAEKVGFLATSIGRGWDATEARAAVAVGLRPVPPGAAFCRVPLGNVAGYGKAERYAVSSASPGIAYAVSSTYPAPGPNRG